MKLYYAVLKAMVLTAMLLIFCSLSALAYNTGDDYPYKNYCSGCHNTRFGDSHTDYSEMGFYYRQCTDFAAWCLRSRNGVSNFGIRYGGANWGNAWDWKAAAESIGITCNNTPAVGSIAQWSSGTYGHVAWVREVKSSTVVIEEYNHQDNPCGFHTREIAISNPTCYIHVADIDTEIRGSEMSTGFFAVLPDGDYLITTAATGDASSFYFLDIENAAAPAANNSNVSLCGPLTGDPQEYDVWTITYDNQFYTIKQKGTNMCLDVNNEDTLQGTNIQVYSGWNTNAQKWAIERNGINGYRVRSKCSGSGNHPMCLDITGGSIINGTNVQQWEYNNSDAQSWLFIPYKPSQPINEGRYVLLYSTEQSYELDVAGDTGVIDNGTNVQIWSDTISSQYNSFDFVKLPNGYYKVIHAASGKCLEVEGGSCKYKTNVSLYGDNGSFAQQWAILRNGSGYSLVSRCNGYALDLPSGATGDGKNIEVYPYLTSDNQRWSFVGAEYTVKYNMNGGVGAIPNQTKYYKSNLSLDKTIPFRADYIFLGWSDSPNSMAPMYQPGDVYSKDADATLYAVWLAPDLKLPRELTSIESEAFASGAFRFVWLQDQTKSIGSQAFADCPNLRYIRIPKATTSIAGNAFTRVNGLTIIGEEGSYAQTYANRYGYTFISEY